MRPTKYVETGRTLMKRNAVTNGLIKVTGKTEVLELKLDTDAVDDVGRLDCRRHEALGVKNTKVFLLSMKRPSKRSVALLS